MSLARVVLSGIVTAAPEKRFTPNQVAVVNFTINVEQPPRGTLSGAQIEQKPFEVKVTCWRQLADVVCDQLQVGTAIIIEGKLMINSYQAPDGSNKKTFEVDASAISILPGGAPLTIRANTQEGQTSGQQNQGNRYATPPAATQAAPIPAAVGSSMATPTGHFPGEDMLTEDDIPF